MLVGGDACNTVCENPKSPSVRAIILRPADAPFPDRASYAGGGGSHRAYSPAAFALSVVMSAVSTAMMMSMTRFSVLFVLSFMINQTHPALRAPHTLIFDCFD